jgi:hypothetical protein
MLCRAQRGEITPPRQVNPRVPAPLEAVCQKAMSASPDDRYSSPHALADEIEHWLYPARAELSHFGRARLRPSRLRHGIARTEARPPFRNDAFLPARGITDG